MRLINNKNLSILILFLNAYILAAFKPINLDLEIYSEWLADPNYYTFDFLFSVIGYVVRLFTYDIRFFIFSISFVIQLIIVKLAQKLFPGVNPLFIALVGSTSFWNISLSSNVLRQGVGFILLLTPFTFKRSTNGYSVALFFFLAAMAHWSMILFSLIYFVGKLKWYENFVRNFTFFICLIISLLVFDNYIDILSKISFYSSSEVFDDTRSSQIPRFLVQISFLLLAQHFNIIPAGMRSYSGLAFIILVLTIPFPEVFSRVSLASGILLHVIIYGYLFSLQKLSPGVKFCFAFLALFFQLLHPSTRVLLGLAFS